MAFEKYFPVACSEQFASIIKNTSRYKTIITMVKRLSRSQQPRLTYSMVGLQRWTKTMYFLNHEKEMFQLCCSYGKFPRMLTDHVVYVRNEDQVTFMVVVPTIDDHLRMNICMYVVRCDYTDGICRLLREKVPSSLRKYTDAALDVIEDTMRQHMAARKIQKACQPWLWKPQCKDGTYGINFRLGWDACQKVIQTP